MLPPPASRTARFIALTFLIFCALDSGQAIAPAPDIKTAEIGGGISLRYIEQGSGTPLIFVHGSLCDGGYWADQSAPFAKHYRVVAYSRRYDYPNENPTRAGYSAITDADDLAALIRVLHLGKAVVVGHSYGALAALFLAVRNPDLLRAMVLAEPPAVSLLAQLTGPQAKVARAAYNDIQHRMVQPMQRAFRHGDRERGVALFVDYVFHDPNAWKKMPASARNDTLKNAHEWDVIMTTGTLFPEIDPKQIKNIPTPTLLLSGAKSYPFLALITDELARLLPNNQSIVFPDTGHQMWCQHPDECREDVDRFLQKAGIQ